MKIIPANITSWQRAKKTKNVRAKPLISLLVDKTVLNKFLVDTLEGREPLGDGVVICIGQQNEAWQQSPKKLLQKYEVKGIDADGWMICEPRPDNSVKVVQVTKEFWDKHSGAKYPDERMYNLGDFAIEGLWGDASYPTLGKNVQWGSIDDYICQNETDPSDVWVVRKKIFENTYDVLDVPLR